jgi:phosphoribosylamine--glycine ligase
MPGKVRVAIIMGSDSDLEVMAQTARVLDDYSIAYDVKILSAHRTPERATRFARGAEAMGLKVIIAGAGAAAHLAGAMAANTTLPVIGVPLAGSPLVGFDALLSTVQMPPGVPVATVGVGVMGAKNAGHLAAQLLALDDAALRRRLKQRREAMATEVQEKSRGLARRLREILSR